MFRNGGSIWGLTGTPILSSPMDLYGLIQSFSLVPQTYRNWSNFTGYFKGVNTRFGWRFPPEPRHDALVPLQPYFIRRRKADVLPQLPEKIYAEYRVTSNFQETVELDEATVVPSNTAAAIGVWRARNAYAKAVAAYDYVSGLVESGEQVVVFSAHTDAANHFGGLGGTITGATSLPNRKALVDAFQNRQLNVLSGTIGAMGLR